MDDTPTSTAINQDALQRLATSQCFEGANLLEVPRTIFYRWREWVIIRDFDPRDILHDIVM